MTNLFVRTCPLRWEDDNMEENDSWSGGNGMKAVVVYEPGGAEQLVYTDVPRPVLREGWSLVRVRAFGVNHSEIFTRQGLSPTVTFPRILGI